MPGAAGEQPALEEDQFLDRQPAETALRPRRQPGGQIRTAFAEPADGQMRSVGTGLRQEAVAAELGLAGVFFWEVLGLHPHEMDESLARRGYPSAGEALASGTAASARSVRARVGLSPHAPYSTVLQAEQALFPSELTLASMRASVFTSAANTYKAMGGGWVTEADKLTGGAGAAAGERTSLPPLF